MFILSSLFFIGVGYALAKPSVIVKCFKKLTKSDSEESNNSNQGEINTI